MTEKITVRYYNGKRNVPFPAELSSDGTYLHIVYGDGQTVFHPIHQAEYISAVGGIPPVLELPDDVRIELTQNDIPDWLNLKHKTMLRHVRNFEKSWKWVGIGFVTVICVMFSMFKWGIPAAAYHVSRHLPDATLKQIGDRTEQAIIQFTKASSLKPERRQKISDLYYKTLKPSAPAKLVFRNSETIGANAFAIPNNTIIITDDLVKLAKHDHEILAVLAHEQGHLKERHSLQQALRGIGTGVFLLVITGDSNDLVSNLPATIAAAQYSQEFEFEADRYAAGELQRLGLPPKYLADFLTRLQKQHGHEEGGTTNLLGSHPLTQERVKRLESLTK